MKHAVIAFIVILSIGILSCETQIGPEGKQALLNSSPEPAGDNCSSGGFKIETGIDQNSNGTLESEEIQSTVFICHGDPGVDGSNGADGSDGTDGKQSLLTIIPEKAGENCVDGGFKVETGIDDNFNGSLDSSEIQTVAYICNGVDGAVDEQIRYYFRSGTTIQSTDGTAWRNLDDRLTIPYFNISNHPDVDSAIFTAVLSIRDQDAECIVELVDLTNGITIPNSQLSTNSVTNIQVTSSNILDSFPEGDITLSIRMRSTVNGISARLKQPELILFRK